MGALLQMAGTMIWVPCMVTWMAYCVRYTSWVVGWPAGAGS